MGIERSLAPRPPALAAAVLSLGAVACALIVARHVGAQGAELSPDEENYVATAVRLLNDRVYSFWGNGPDAYVSPGYPVFLTLIFALFGPGGAGQNAVRALQCVLSGGTVFLTFLLGRELTKRDWAGVFAAALVTATGAYYVYTRMFLTETLYYFLMLLSLWLFVRAEEADPSVRSGVAGLVFGAAVMVRSLVVAALPFLLLPRLLRRRRDKRVSLRPVWLFLAGFLIPCLPWWIRNLVTLRRLVLWATQTNPLYAGLAERMDDIPSADPGSYLGNFKLLFRMLAEHPRSTLEWMTLGKFRVIFLDDVAMPIKSVSDVARGLAVFPGLCGAGMALLRRRTRLYSLPFWVYFLCIFFSVAELRYAYQYLPLLAIFSGWTLSMAWEALRAGGKSPPEG